MTVILPLIFKLLVLVIGLIFGGLAYLSSIEGNLLELGNLNKKLYYFFGLIWGLPIISTIFFIAPLNLGSKILKYLDQGWLEEIGGQGLYKKLNQRTSILDS